jgi:hypothetical protein
MDSIHCGCLSRPVPYFLWLPRSKFFPCWMAGLSFFCGVNLLGQIIPSSSTTGWTPILYPAGSPTLPDPINDQQTGIGEGDIVGNTTHPSLYKRFYDGGTPSLTDGQMAFRFRVSEDKPSLGQYSGSAFVGFDAGQDGDIDMFVGIDSSGSTNIVGIYLPGAGANTSPSTTTIVSTPVFSVAQSASNYSWMAVTATTDPTATNFDLDGGGKADFFLSFVVPFSSLVSAFNSNLGMSIDQNTPFAFVAATSTQTNSLTQDLNGVNGGTSSTSTWSQLGGLTSPYSSSGTAVVPEPGSFALLSLSAGIFGIAFLRSRRR